MSMQRHREVRIVLETIFPNCNKENSESSHKNLAEYLCFRELCNISNNGNTPKMSCLFFENIFLILCRYRTGDRHID